MTASVLQGHNVWFVLIRNTGLNTKNVPGPLREFWSGLTDLLCFVDHVHVFLCNNCNTPCDVNCANFHIITVDKLSICMP